MKLNKKQEIIINRKLIELKKSKFRNSFHLNQKMKNMAKEKGLRTIQIHTKDFIQEKLKEANPKNDGKQTPMRNHPSFIAMHACGCCCRNCLWKWHHIEKGRELTKEEENYIEALLLTWIIKEVKEEKIERDNKKC